jgi:hypothetical protein
MYVEMSVCATKLNFRACLQRSALNYQLLRLKLCEGETSKGTYALPVSGCCSRLYRVAAKEVNY